MNNRRGDWMQTYSGRAFWPVDPIQEDVCIEDIAKSLSKICRFNGHGRRFYSVAEHSVLASRALPDELALCGLLHDAAEAYIGDVIRPIKPFLLGLAEIESAIEKEIALHFSLPWPFPDEVKRIDNAILADEAAHIMSKPPMPWHLPEPPLGVVPCGWDHNRAWDEFMFRYEELL